MGKKLDSVWVISKYASPQRYGVSSKPYRTAKYLSEKNLEVYLISSNSNHLAKYPNSNKIYNFEKIENLNHIWIQSLIYKKSASMKRIISWFIFEYRLFMMDKNKLKKPNVVIISSLSILTILYGIYLKNKFKCKLIFEIRDIYPLTLTEELGVSRYNPLVILFGIIEKLGYRRSDLIVGTMPNLIEHVKNVLGYEKKTFFSPLGINAVWTKEVKESNKIDNLFPKGNKVIVGYAGSMGITNALDCFIDTIERFKDDKELFFVLVGDGDKKEDYYIRLKGNRNVIIGPKIKQDEIPYFLSKCDILYLSTKKSKIWNFGQSMNKIVDYMMAGKPVVASYSGHPSMLNEANSGVFVDAESSEAIMKSILKYKNMNNTQRIEIGARGRKWIESNYSNDIICEKYMKEIIDVYSIN